MSYKLYVGNLSFDTAEIQLEDLFAEVGRVEEASLVQDTATGRSRGFAFITMSTASDAEEAIRRFHGSDLNGRTLSVTLAHAREDKFGSPAPRNRFRPRR